MITKAKFTNFKSLRDVEIPLGRFNVLVGANGVGKSSVLEGLEAVLGAIQIPGHRERYPELSHRLRISFGKYGGLALCRSLDTVAPVQIGFDLVDSTSFLVVGRVLVDRDDMFETRITYEGNSRVVPDEKGSHVDLARVERERVGNGRLIRMEATRLGEPHHSTERQVELAYDGSGLASVLQRIQISRDGTLEDIERGLAQVVPSAKRIRTTQESMELTEHVPVTVEGQTSMVPHRRRVTGAGFEVEWGGAGWIPAKQLSEGTLLALGLITLLHYQPPTLVLIDDLDRGLHPTAQQELVDLLRKVCDQNPGLQVLATTHSPYVVDKMSPEDVLVCAGTEDRGTQIRRLSEHPTWSKQKDYLQPGEFWSATGEKWVAEPRA